MTPRLAAHRGPRCAGAPVRRPPLRPLRSPRPLRLLAGLACLALLGAALLGALAGCGNTVGDDGTFKPAATDNTDFAPPYYVPLGNLPITMDLWPRGAALSLLAVVNSVAADPLNPDGTVNPTGTVTVLQNSPPGTFTATATLSTMPFPSLALWAHLQNATDPDLVILDNQNTHVAIYLSQGLGVFGTVPSQEFTLSGVAGQLTITDLEGDGLEDVVITVPASTQIVALHADPGGSGVLTEADTTTPNALGRFFAGNLNGDGNLDLAALSALTISVEEWQWDGTLGTHGRFAQTLAVTPTVPFALPQHASFIVGGNLLSAAPAPPDLAVLTDVPVSGADYLYVYPTDGAGAPVTTGTLGLPVTVGANLLVPLGPVAGPFVDLAVMHTSLRWFTYLKSGGGTYAVITPATTRNCTDAVAGQVTADAAMDIVTVESERRTIGIFAGDGLGNFVRTEIGLLTLPSFPRIVDVDGVGKDDLLVLEPNSDRLAVFLNLNP